MKRNLFLCNLNFDYIRIIKLLKYNSSKFFSETHHSSHCSITFCQSDCCSVMSCRPHSSRRQRKALDVMSRQVKTSRLKALNIRALQTNVTSDEFLRKLFCLINIGLLQRKSYPFMLQKAVFYGAKAYLLQCCLGCFVIHRHYFRVMLTAIRHCGYAETVLPLNDFWNNLRYVLIS